MLQFGEDIIIVFIITVDAFMNLIWALIVWHIIKCNNYHLLAVSVINGHRN